MRPIFHLYGHIALKFNIKPVCDVFLKTQDLKYLPISNGNSIFASKKGKIFGPISNVNFRLECNSLSCWKNFSYVDLNFFSLKCPTPKLLKANVVYKFDCLCDINISYIGKTKRHLATRIKEHRSEKSAIGHADMSHT